MAFTEIKIKQRDIPSCISKLVADESREKLPVVCSMHTDLSLWFPDWYLSCDYITMYSKERMKCGDRMEGGKCPQKFQLIFLKGLFAFHWSPTGFPLQ